MTDREPSARQWRIGLGVASPLVAVLIFSALLALVGAGLWATVAGDRPVAQPGASDAVLYRAVIADVRQGAPYYQAATREQRRLHYPLRPFIAVRPPLLAVTMAALPGEPARRAVLAVLAVATLGAWGWRLAGLRAGNLELTLALLLLGSGVVLAFAPPAYLFHETWAGLLIALSLALRRPERWGLSLLVGLVAALTREMAAAYLLAMAVLAWRDGCRREAIAWVAALAAAGAALAAHAAEVNAQLRPGDLMSQGWLRGADWTFVLAAIHWNAPLVSVGLWASAIAAPLALLGLAAWRGPLGERTALTVLGYMVAFAFVGRPENSYWGLLIAPLWPLGLLLAPRAALGLWRVLWPRGAKRPALTPRRP